MRKGWSKIRESEWGRNFGRFTMLAWCSPNDGKQWHVSFFGEPLPLVFSSLEMAQRTAERTARAELMQALAELDDSDE